MSSYSVRAVKPQIAQLRYLTGTAVFSDIQSKTCRDQTMKPTFKSLVNADLPGDFAYEA